MVGTRTSVAAGGLRDRSPRGNTGGFTLIELMTVVVILGILAAIAIPALTKYQRRTKTSEARLQLARVFDSTVAYFNESHAERGAVDFIDGAGTVTPLASHKCPHPAGSPTGGSADPVFTPVADCSVGPGGRCVPVMNPSGPGYYAISQWNDNVVWNALNFQLSQGHFFHYNFKATNVTTGFGTCRFTSQAFGDLDADGVYSTFERSGAADLNGVAGAAGLYIHEGVE